MPFLFDADVVFAGTVNSKHVSDVINRDPNNTVSNVGLREIQVR